MKKFIVKAAKPQDKFYMSESSDFIYLYCEGLNDLKKTIRCITPRGYNVRSTRWFSRYLKWNKGKLELRNPFFSTTMFEITEVKTPADVSSKIEYTNGFGFTHTLKLVDQGSIPPELKP